MDNRSLQDQENAEVLTRLTHRLRDPVVVAGVLLAALLVAPIVHGYLTNPPDQRLVDLDVYRTGGQSVLTGRPLYQVLTQPPQLLPFTYPPVAAVLAVPLALLPWRAAQWVWVGFIYVPLAVTVWYAFRRLLARTGRFAPLLAGMLVAATAYLMPMRDQMRFGQVDIALTALCVADCAARAPRWPRGLLTGLATAVKLVPGVFVIYLWLTGRRRAAATAAATTATLSLLTFLLLPADSADYWLGAIFDSGRLGDNLGTSNQSLRGMLLRLFLPHQAPGWLWPLCLVPVAVFGFVAARRAAAAGEETAGVAITGLLAVLLSPVAWIHHCVWVVVVLGALVGDGRDGRRVVVACVVYGYFVLTVPWYGVTLLHTSGIPKLVGRAVQDGFGLAALALLPVLGRWLPRRAARRPGAPARPVRITNRIRA